MAVNRTVFQGRLTADIEKRQTQSGVSVVSFTLAWNEKYKETETKCFQRCTAWRATADFIDKYLHDKGTEMIVEGQLATSEWTDKDGNQRHENVLTVDKVHFCGKRQGGAVQEGQTQTAQAPEAFQPVSAAEEGELPF